jgi:hypothetical protein
MASFEVGEDLRSIPRGSAYSFLALRPAGAGLMWDSLLASAVLCGLGRFV